MTTEQLLAYSKKRQKCPACGSGDVTVRGSAEEARRVADKSRREDYADMNACSCGKCKWFGVVDQLFP